MGKKQDEAVFGFVLMTVVVMLVAVAAPIYWAGRFLFRKLIGRSVRNSSSWKKVDDAWSRGDYDLAREALQRVAYTMVGKGVSEQEKREFTKLMTEFAKEDPLYREVMDRALPLIRATPGIQQSKIYVGQPDHIKEQMRYVFYFAHEIGDIVRHKKGRSYALYPAGQMVDGKAIIQTEKMMQTINAKRVCELMYSLFMAKPWLNKAGVMTKDDALAESEAIMFLQSMAQHDVNSFGDTSAAAQRIVNSLLLDFMAKVTRPTLSWQSRTWQVDTSVNEATQALQVIAAEIARNSPAPKLTH